MLYSHSISSFTVKEVGYLDNSGVAKKTAEDILKFAQKKEQLTREVLSTVEKRKEFTGFPVVTGWSYDSITL